MLSGLIDRWFIKQPRLRRAVTRLLEGDWTGFVEVLGTRLCANSILEHGYLRAARLSMRSSLLRDELPALLNVAALLADGDTFVDAGANVGAWCCTMARFQSLYPRLAVWAFEAHPGTYARLVQSAQGQPIWLENVALSDRAGRAEFVEGAVSHVFTTIANASGATLQSQRPIPVVCARLDSFPVPGDSMVIKIDVEGQELEVLEGTRGFFEARRVKAVFIDGYKQAAVLDFLRARGFRLFEGRSLRPVADGALPYNVLAVAG